MDGVDWILKIRDPRLGGDDVLLYLTTIFERVDKLNLDRIATVRLVEALKEPHVQE